MDTLDNGVLVSPLIMEEFASLLVDPGGSLQYNLHVAELWKLLSAA